MNTARGHLDEQIRRNQSTRGSFDDFAPHRARVMQLLRDAAADVRPAGEIGEVASAKTPGGEPQPTLLVLGAGNCNDVDLPALLTLFGRVELVDCDASALSAGCRAQGVEGHPRLTLRGNVDLTADHETAPVPPADVVASLCVLSQLVDAVLQAEPSSKPSDKNELDQNSTVNLDAQIDAVRRQHFNLLIDRLAPGGIGLLVTDFTSSLTAPQLAIATDEQLPAVAAWLLGQGNFFRGLHPGVLHRQLSTDPEFSNRVDCQNPTSPWNWKVGNRVYAVSAIRLRRAVPATGITGC